MEFKITGMIKLTIIKVKKKSNFGDDE